jgi:ABC-type Fe3+-siderophore transport system permease subunit
MMVLSPHPGRQCIGLLLAVLVLLVVSAMSLWLGARPVAPSLVWQALTGQCPVDSLDCSVVMQARLPRTLAGLLAGAALGLAGVVMQTLTRNPLAEPGILGVNAGASFAVVMGICFFGAATPDQFFLWAFGGALLATILVALTGSTGSGRLNPLRLTLAGVALGAVLEGMSSGIALLNPLVFDQLRFWQAGTLDIQNIALVRVISVPVGVGILLSLLLCRALNNLSMGDELAAALGTRVVRTQLAGIFAITLLCGGATAMVGPLAFVGLMMPHLARLIAGTDHRWLLPWTLVLTPTMLLIADLVGRVLVPGELRVSVVMAFLGAPVLIVLVRRYRGNGL